MSQRTPRILVTGAGGAAAVVLLEHFSARATLHAADIDPLAAGLYLAPEGHRHIVPRGDSGRLVPALLQLCERYEIDVLVPTVDMELLEVSRAQERFRAVGTQVLVASPTTLELCLDKLRLCRHLSGIAPRSEPLLEADPSDWTYPVLVKPRDGAGGRGIRMVHDEEALRALPARPKDMIQQYLPGTEYSVDVLRLGGVILAAVPRERLKVDSGVAVAARTVRALDVEAAARYAANAIDLHGVANVQLRRDTSGVPRLMEINARFPGTMSITIAAGADLPNAWLDHTLTGTVPPAMSHQEVAMVRTWTNHVIEGFVKADARTSR